MAKMSNLAARASLDAITLLVNTSGPGTMEVRTGAAPATCEASDSGDVLAVLTFSADGFPDSSDGVDKATVDASAIADEDAALTGGDPGHFRVKDGAGTVIFQGTAGGPASGMDCEFNKTTFVIADVVQVDTMTLEVAE